MAFNSPKELVDLTAQGGQPHTLDVKGAIPKSTGRPLDRKIPLRDRLKPLQHKIASRPVTELPADKVFFDELSGHRR